MLEVQVNKRKPISGFYSMDKEKRIFVVQKIYAAVLKSLTKNDIQFCYSYFVDEDTYIRKAAYESIGKLYIHDQKLLPNIINLLEIFSKNAEAKVRQTAVNAAGEVGKYYFEAVQHFFDRGLFDAHHSVRNAVIGSVKKMGEVNPLPILAWAKLYIHHPDKEIRREICHGIELRGRKHPEDILPLLKELQWDVTARVRKTLVHVLGQIAYKKGCLEKVLDDLKTWENQELVKDAHAEIIDVHRRYKNFAFYTEEEARGIVHNYKS